MRRRAQVGPEADGWQAKTSLSDAEMAGVAIAYNTGRYDPAKGLEARLFDGSKYYGENYYAYLATGQGRALSRPPRQRRPRDTRALPEAGGEGAQAAKKAAESPKKLAKPARRRPGL